jgi:polysaccharide pyruvyl transferase WcaK-like protein
LIGCCWATVSTRYHFCLFSALQGVPFIALQRSDKVNDLCFDVHWSYGVPIEAVTPEALLDLYVRIERERPAWTALLKSSSAQMRQRALKNQETFDSLLSPALQHSGPTI